METIELFLYQKKNKKLYSSTGFNSRGANLKEKKRK